LGVDNISSMLIFCTQHHTSSFICIFKTFCFKNCLQYSLRILNSTQIVANVDTMEMLEFYVEMKSKVINSFEL
jgi:hypothetical protein